MQLKRTLLIKVEEQSDKYFDHFSDSIISASERQNQMQTRKSFENNLSKSITKTIVQLVFTKKKHNKKQKQRIQKQF